MDAQLSDWYTDRCGELGSCDTCCCCGSCDLDTVRKMLSKSSGCRSILASSSWLTHPAASGMRGSGWSAGTGAAAACTCVCAIESCSGWYHRTPTLRPCTIAPSMASSAAAASSWLPKLTTAKPAERPLR
eukprot:364743-Chlamydomonas_euryale.AAC.55